MLQSVDLFLLGRVMWPGYREYWKQALGNMSVSHNHRDYAALAEKTKHIIFSGILQESGWKNATVYKGPAVEEIAKLKMQPGNNIQVVGGAKLAASVMEAGLVDEYRLRINPVILGAGKSFFLEQYSRQSLELRDIKNLASGVVIYRYQLKKYEGHTV
ncbi:MAG: dihydrofolate reductase family protein [Bacteroidota bacterium]